MKGLKNVGQNLAKSDKNQHLQNNFFHQNLFTKTVCIDLIYVYMSPHIFFWWHDCVMCHYNLIVNVLWVGPIILPPILVSLGPIKTKGKDK